MISMPLFKSLIKKNWKIWAIFVAVHVLYMGVITAMSTDPLILESMEFLNMALETGGMSEPEVAVTVVSSVFYGLIVFVFSMIYYLLLSQKLGNKVVDNTSLSSYLSSSMSRKQYIVTCAIFLIVSLLALYLLLFIVSTSIILTIFGSFNVLNFASMHLTVYLCTLFVAFISFSCSAIFAGSRWAMGLLCGIPIAFASILMLSTIINASFLKWITPFGWLNTIELATGTFNLWWMWNLIFTAAIAALFFLTVKLFNKKQLSI